MWLRSPAVFTLPAPEACARSHDCTRLRLHGGLSMHLCQRVKISPMWLTVIGCWVMSFLCSGIHAEPPATRSAQPQVEWWTAPDYIAWLEKRSMLYQARKQARRIVGRSKQWRHTYAKPQPQAVVKHASVWVLGYPGAVVTRPDESVIATWANPEALENISRDRHRFIAHRPRQTIRRHHAQRLHPDDRWLV